jgi:hypothetical protein
VDSFFARYERFSSVRLRHSKCVKISVEEMQDRMPLKRRSDVKQTDGRVSVGSISKRVKVDDREVWARVSHFGHKAEVTFNYMPDVKTGMLVDYEEHRFRVEGVMEPGIREHIRLEYTVVA